MNPDSLHGIPPYLIAVPIALVLILLRMRGLMKGRRLRLEWLWVMPAVLLAIAVMTIATSHPARLDWLWMLMALAVGAGLGWYRGKMMQISVDPETHALNSKGSPAALIFILVLIAIRFGLRYLALTEAQAWHLNAALITDIFIVFAVGLFGVQRLEMWLRGSRLLGEARAARASETAVPASAP
jgi:NAD/NADP transhydrogenase beta subunit